MEVPPAQRAQSPRKKSQSEEDTEPPEPAIPVSGQTPFKTNGYEETNGKTTLDSMSSLHEEPLKEVKEVKEVKESEDIVNGDDASSTDKDAQDQENQQERVQEDEADTSATPVQKRNRGSRSQRELNNLAIDTPKKEEQVIDEGAPRSRFGRVQKPKTPAAKVSTPTPASKVSTPTPASKRKVPLKTPSIIEEEEGVPSSELTNELTNGITPSKAAPKDAKTPRTKPSTSNATSTPLVLTSAPERRTVFFGVNQRIVCSRVELLKLQDKDEEAQYSVGDLVWSKLTGYPFWPCLVTMDPLEGIYSKVDSTTDETVYHVQYFGNEGSRGWTKPRNVIPFEGLERYKELGETSTPVASKKGKPKPSNKYAVESKSRKQWDIAVAEAEYCFKLSPLDRLEVFTYEYKMFSDNNISTKEGHKRKLPATPSGPKAKRKKNQSSPEDIYDFGDEDDDGPVEIPSSPFKLLSAKKKGDFEEFKRREQPRVKRENSKLSDQELEQLMQTKWSFLGEDQKAIYVDRTKTDESFPSEKDKDPQSLKTTPKVKTVQPKTPAILRAKPTPKNTPSSQRKSSGGKDTVVSAAKLSFESSPSKPRKARESVAKNVESVADSAPKKVTVNVPVAVSVRKRSRKQESSDQESQVSSLESSQVWDETTSQSDVASELEGETQKVPFGNVCFKCFDKIPPGSETVTCSGVCLRTYDMKCVASLTESASCSAFKCQECKSGNHLCFICNKTRSDVEESSPLPVKCMESSCGRFYHTSCLSTSYPHKKMKPSKDSTGQDAFLCPLHFCLSCHNDHQEDNVYRSAKRKLLTCIKCPTAYHLLNDCVSAGSTTIVEEKYILCSEHIEIKKSDKSINVSFCFACMSGGNLVCCERCPAAFHSECLEFEVPEGSFYCSSCLKRKQLRYGDLVWVKFGRFRWWPSKILLPHHTPDNLMKMDWKRGQFVVHFLGTNDHAWLDYRSVFPYEEGDALKPLAHVGSSKMDRNFKRALEAAKEEYQTYLNEKNSALKMKVKKWPPYKHIKVNKPIGNVILPNPEHINGNDRNGEALNKCECSQEAEAPCSSDEDCLNRVMMIECSAKTCAAGDKCQNQRFQKREYVKTLKPFNTGSRGWGLKAFEDIKKGQFVIEYVGELISEEECEKRLGDKVKNNDNNFYFLTIDKDCIIDAGPSGNLARFMNHSCDPNCATHKWVVAGTVRIGLFAVRDIPSGTELTFNYNLDARGSEKTVCSCGAKNCSQYIGLQPKKAVSLPTTTPKGQKKKGTKTTEKKREKKKQFAANHEDFCYACGDAGTLIMCDQKSCTKSYHKECLKITTLPRGIWICPWHHCDDCGKTATVRCLKCPVSFCASHASSPGEDGMFTCSACHAMVNGDDKPEQVDVTLDNSMDLLD